MQKSSTWGSGSALGERTHGRQCTAQPMFRIRLLCCGAAPTPADRSERRNSSSGWKPNSRESGGGGVSRRWPRLAENCPRGRTGLRVRSESEGVTSGCPLQRGPESEGVTSGCPLQDPFRPLQDPSGPFRTRRQTRASAPQEVTVRIGENFTRFGVDARAVCGSDWQPPRLDGVAVGDFPEYCFQGRA